MCWKIQLRHGAERPPRPWPGRGGARSTPWETSGSLSTWDTPEPGNGELRGRLKERNPSPRRGVGRLSLRTGRAGDGRLGLGKGTGKKTGEQDARVP